jgi:hypothetical protein
MRDKLYVQNVERWCSELKFKIKGKDILPYMETKLITLIENPESIYNVIWNKYAPNVIGIEGFYTRFAVGDIMEKEDILKMIEVQ